MSLRSRLIGLVGTLMLAVSPTAIVLAQDAQAPTTEAPAPGKPSVEDVLKRHKLKQQAAPDDSQSQDAAPVKPRQGKQKPEAVQDDAGRPPNAADDGAGSAPAMKPRRQKPAPAAEAPAAEPPAAEEPAQPTMKPKRQKPAPAAEAPAAEAPAAQEAAPPSMKPKAGGAKPGTQTTPADPAPSQGDEQQGGAAKPPRQRTQRPAGNGQENETAPAPGAEPQAAPDQQGQGQGKRRERPNQQGTTPGNEGQSQGQDDGQDPGQPRPGRLRPNGQGADQGPGNTAQPGQGDSRPQQAPVNRAAEQRALGLLGDNTPPDRLNDQQLRQQLDEYRSVLAAGNLSQTSEQALIQRLNSTRAALRNRVSQQEDTYRQNGQGGRNSQFGRPQFQQGSPRPQDIPAILADRRPSGVLTIDQLNRRILVYRDAANDQRYNPEDRGAFAQYLQDDRGELRRRLLSDRGQRNDRLRRDESGGDLRLDMDVAPRGPRQQSVWAAEVDDDQIEEQFAARPLRPLPRRFPRADFFAQPEMVMEQPFVRQSIPSVELDTIHFGFNESFIREEEIANLDRIGRILERIVAAHPNEVFVIEGNTDAVGDDAYNLRLSKERAEAVKQALTQYYVISPDNLVTAGLGERYLKIPTPEPEQENRRVTIRRVTPLLQN